MEPISRRRALQLGGLGLVTAVVGGGGLLLASRDEDDSPARSGSTFREPEVLTSRNGLLEVRLEAAEGTHRLAGTDATTLAYNNTVPGPTLRVRPGDTLRITLVNALDAPTNLHTHGLQVSPEGNSDNVFVHVGPGESFEYEYELGDDHLPGTYWYHPHLHGLVASQLFAGLYGAIIVEDPDELPLTRERLVLIGDTTLDGSGRVVSASRMQQRMGREGDLVLVNGEVDPVMNARPGEREHWRVVNACTSRFLALRLDGQPVQLLGLDAGRFAEPRDPDGLLLAPGNRAELIVTATAGTSFLEAVAYDRMSGTGGGPGFASGTGQTVRLATLDVSGSPVEALAALPAGPPPPDLTSAPVARARRLTFSMSGGGGPGGGFGAGGGGGPRFLIDGQEFDEDRIDQEVVLGTVEEWTISNESPMDHPFHLHVWPMQILERGGRPVASPTWQDVVNIPSGSSVKTRIAFERIGGKAVYHCHILDHEDLGMMGTVRAR